MYELAAKLAKLAENGQSYKTALYSIKNKKKIKSVHFLASNATRRRELIDELLRRSGAETGANTWLARVAVAELLWGRRRLPSSNPLFRKITLLKDKLVEILPTLENETDSKGEVEIPRYIRLNTELLTKSSAVSKLRDLGFELVQTPSAFPLFISLIKSLKRKQFLFDYNVPNLLVFHAKAKIAQLSPIEFIRQDKSSCLVGLLLAPVPGSTLLDMCAAPGYKTQHAASLISGIGTIYSIDINKERFKTLEGTCKKFGLEGSCRPINIDALKVTEELCPDVEYIIVDPPCSGTGMVNVLVEHVAEGERLRRLGNLQAMLLKQGLAEFPSARRLVYSTCSVEEAENEAVVAECLSLASELGWRLVPLAGAFAASFSPGIGSSPAASHVIRLSPGAHLTNGFFIALFERSHPPKIPRSKAITLATDQSKSENVDERSSSSESESSSADEHCVTDKICAKDKDTTSKIDVHKGKRSNKMTENCVQNSVPLKRNSPPHSINKTKFSKGIKQSKILLNVKSKKQKKLKSIRSKKN